MRPTFISSIIAAVAIAEPNPPNWDTDRVLIFDPSDTDCQSRVDKVWEEMGGSSECDHGQWSDSRYALLFKPGQHQCNVNVGYYTQVIGLGLGPSDTRIANLYSPDNCGIALNNFWRGVENAEFGHEQTNIPWHVSQAAPMRRTRIVGDITLGKGWSSGGYMANSEVTGTIYAGSQQQWFNRNVSMGNFVKGGWNFVFVGCPGAPATNCGQDGTGIPATTIDETPIIAEKPYITVSGDKYTLHRPEYKTNQKGPDFKDGAHLIDFTAVYVASASDSASTINAKLATGLHVVLQPGIYNLDQALNVTHDGQVLLGIGMPTLSATNGNALVEVADGIDARIAGLTLEAGKVKSENLLKWGTDTSKGNAATPGIISDVFGRTGGRNDSRDYSVESERMFQINNKHVIIDHSWLWRADHDFGGLVYESRNYSGQGLQVNADYVKTYGLFSEHHLGDLVEWNGNHGEAYFFQSELPYDVTQENFADKGFAGFKVSDDVTDFTGYGIAVYTFFRDHSVFVDSGIKAPIGPKINFTNSYAMFLTGQGGLRNILNNEGTGVQDSFRNSYLCVNDTEETFTQTNAGAALFLQ